MPHPHPMSCEKCGHRQQFTLWQSLNATLNPEEKKSLLKGTLLRFTCEKCGHSAGLVYPMLYHDMPKQLMIWLWPAEGDPESGELHPTPLMNDYQLRIVPSPNRLMEKILIFDHDPDDRLIEALKVFIRVRSVDTDQKIEGQLLFASLQSQPEKIRFEHLQGSGVHNVAVPRETYDKLLAGLSARLPPLDSLAGKWVRVDQAFGQSLALQLTSR